MAHARHATGAPAAERWTARAPAGQRQARRERFVLNNQSLSNPKEAMWTKQS